MADLITFTDSETVGAVSTDNLGMIPLLLGHSYMFKYTISVMDSGGAQAYYEYIMHALRDGGGVSIGFFNQTFADETVFSPDTLEITSDIVSTRVYVVGSGLTGLTLRWRAQVYLLNDRLI